MRAQFLLCPSIYNAQGEVLNNFQYGEEVHANLWDPKSYVKSIFGAANNNKTSIQYLWFTNLRKEKSCILARFVTVA